MTARKWFRAALEPMTMYNYALVFKPRFVLAGSGDHFYSTSQDRFINTENFIFPVDFVISVGMSRRRLAALWTRYSDPVTGLNEYSKGLMGTGAANSELLHVYKRFMFFWWREDKGLTRAARLSDAPFSIDELKNI